MAATAQDAILARWESARLVADAHKLLANHKDGTFGKWIRERCGFTPETARKLRGAHQLICKAPLQYISQDAATFLAGEDIDEKILSGDEAGQNPRK